MSNQKLLFLMLRLGIPSAGMVIDVHVRIRYPNQERDRIRSKKTRIVLLSKFKSILRLLYDI